MSVCVSSIRDNLRATYPDDFFCVSKCTPPGGACWYYGTILIEAQLKDGDWLRVYRLAKSSGHRIDNNEVKQKALPFVIDTKHITNEEKRRDQLRDSLKSVFPQHHVNIFIFDRKWESAYTNKGHASFSGEYGSLVSIILT